MEDQVSQEPVNSFENIDFNSSDGNKEITVEQEEEQVPCETPIFFLCTFQLFWLLSIIIIFIFGLNFGLCVVCRVHAFRHKTYCRIFSSIAFLGGLKLFSFFFASDD